MQTVTSQYNKLDLLRLMVLSREGDRREGILLRQSKGWFQVSGHGHEAIAALVHHLRPDDFLFPYYRDRAMLLQRGVTNFELALAYFAKRDSSSGGRQMPAHFSCRRHNIFSVATPTATSLLPAAGAAWGMKLSGTDTVAIASVGDASSRQGEFYEAIAFAFQEKLPVVFLVEDNKFGISTPTEKFLPFHLDILSEHAFTHVDARHPDNVYEATGKAIAKARRGEGPSLLWCDVDRLGSHTSSDDHRVYRTADDIDRMFKRDPIVLLAQELIAAGELTQEAFDRMQDEVKDEVDADYLRAEREEDPRASELELHNFSGEEDRVEAPPLQPAERVTMVQAINQTFRKALEDDPKVIFFGEDIEDPKGGVFGMTKGLSEAFPRQVFNSPLAEATIFGVAVGLAAYGMKPVFELQFIDFISPAWNQLVTNISTLRWRTFGTWKCPMTIYAPCGAYLPGGSLWHSQTNEGGLAHVSGIRVAVPSTPEDASGLLWTAMHGDDPTFVLVPKHVFRKPVAVVQAEPVPLGKARLVKEGRDCTVVVWGNCVELAEEAAAKLAGECDVEILDLRSIVPCDYEAIVRSVDKTGRLVVIHEDTRTCGFGQAIVSEMTTDPDRFQLFLAAPQLVTRPDVPIGYNPIYEYASLPDLDQVVAAIRTTMA
ncbi:MAG: hypothetical protein KIS66_11330 [Fimbriimonadaceae bacterium]|nr:hypothetical protein [Fimbriimonadaceae bacterium]